MQIQPLTGVCSLMHLHSFKGENEAKACINQAIRDARGINQIVIHPEEAEKWGNIQELFNRYDVQLNNAKLIAEPSCDCGSCRMGITRLERDPEYKKIKGWKPRKGQSTTWGQWKYRYLMFVTGGGDVYVSSILKEFGFAPITQYEGYMDKTATIWGLSIPEYIKTKGEIQP